MGEPKWKKGDLVRHRASKQVALVFGEPRFGRLGLKATEGVFLYDLDTGFGDEALQEVPEFVLEDAPEGFLP